jgi:hypothetical protein
MELAMWAIDDLFLAEDSGPELELPRCSECGAFLDDDADACEPCKALVQAAWLFPFDD